MKKFCIAGSVYLLLGVGFAGAAPLDLPAPDLVAEARAIVQEMIANPRGPYSRIRWFCNDGTTQPPVAYACREHGGGRQHAEYSPKRQRLQELGFSVGTIFASTSFEELFESQPRQQRLRELALERYLTDIDNGWVLKNAQGYRGRVQVEDEEVAGRHLLLRLFSDTDWLATNFLLARELTRVIPHGEDSDLARKIRRVAIELAEMDPAAERWRAEIHSTPSAETAGRLRKWLAAKPRPKIAALGESLAQDLDNLYGPAGRKQRIRVAISTLGASDAARKWRRGVTDAMAAAPTQRIYGLCDALGDARAAMIPVLGDSERLALLDAMRELESEVQLSYQEIVGQPGRSRNDIMNLSVSLVHCAFGSGMLSATEHAALVRQFDIGELEVMPVADYKAAISRLKRAPNWAVGTIRHAFAEPLQRYSSLDPRAARFSDDLLRGSPMWILGDVLKILSRDLDYLSGSVVEMNGEAVATAVALNGGIAQGTLRIFETIQAVDDATLSPTDVVVLPETIAELAPVAGILTLGEGNALSHVQLLARNFGIPNVAIDQNTVDRLRPLENTVVVLVVDDNGNVVLRRQDETTAAVLDESSRLSAAPAQITVPVPELNKTRILPLADIERKLSGRVIGPKAANLGELNRLFPGRVAPAIAIPFGVYALHLERAHLTTRIRDVFAANAAKQIERTEFDAALANVRSEIAAIELSGNSREALTAAMQKEFGDPGTYGVFVRSDTNVEDLPQFTGAGLNETIPNVVGLEAQQKAIPRVWSSVFSPRALAWRSNVLTNPDQIYASVLLMKSVPASKSGVLVTANLFEKGSPGLTASVAWGVGGAVAGEPAESVVIFENSVDSYSEAKSPYQRAIPASGGVAWLPAPSGPVLVESELAALRNLADEVNEKYAPVFDDAGNARPWDIEFGFVDGELTLFQIRPLVERGNRNAGAIIRQLLPDIVEPARNISSVVLGQVPGT